MGRTTIPKEFNLSKSNRKDHNHDVIKPVNEKKRRMQNHRLNNNREVKRIAKIPEMKPEMKPQMKPELFIEIKEESCSTTNNIINSETPPQLTPPREFRFIEEPPLIVEDLPWYLRLISCFCKIY